VPERGELLDAFVSVLVATVSVIPIVVGICNSKQADEVAERPEQTDKDAFDNPSFPAVAPRPSTSGFDIEHSDMGKQTGRVVEL
jgi:hypothetical protein